MSQQTPAAIFDSTLRLLEEFTAISSPSGDKAGLHAAAECLAKALERCGLRTEIREQPDDNGTPMPVLYARGPDLFADNEPDRSGPRYLLIVGHLDTVVTAERPERRDGRLYATGATDMKGGLITLVGALDLLAAEGRNAPTDLLVAVVPDEEVGGRLTEEVVADLGQAAHGLWVLEPGRTEGDSETLVISRRGMFRWQLEVEGQSAHAGNAFWQGRSALNAAADWCVRASALSTPGLGPTVNAGRLVAGDQSFVDDLAAGAAMIGTARQINVVPDRALVEGEARFLSRADGERLALDLGALAEQVAEEHRTSVRFQNFGAISPFPANEASQTWAQRAQEAASSRGWRLEIEDDRPGISFPNFLPANVTIPALDGLGPVGGGMHTREEFVELKSLDRRIVLLAELLAAAAQG